MTSSLKRGMCWGGNGVRVVVDARSTIIAQIPEIVRESCLSRSFDYNNAGCLGSTHNNDVMRVMRGW